MACLLLVNLIKFSLPENMLNFHIWNFDVTQFSLIYLEATGIVPSRYMQSASKSVHSTSVGESSSVPPRPRVSSTALPSRFGLAKKASQKVKYNNWWYIKDRCLDFLDLFCLSLTQTRLKATLGIGLQQNRFCFHFKISFVMH